MPRKEKERVRTGTSTSNAVPELKKSRVETRDSKANVANVGSTRG